MLSFVVYVRSLLLVMEYYYLCLVHLAAMTYNQVQYLQINHLAGEF